MNETAFSLLLFLAALLPFAFVAFRVVRNIRAIVKRFEDPEELARMVAAHRRALADDAPEGDEPDIRVVIGDREFRWGDPPDAPSGRDGSAPFPGAPTAPRSIAPTPIGVGSEASGRGNVRIALSIVLAVLAALAMRKFLA